MPPRARHAQQPKEDHRTLNHQVSQYLQYTEEPGNDYSVLDLSSLNGEFQIDPSLTNGREHSEITAAAAAVIAYQNEAKRRKGEKGDNDAPIESEDREESAEEPHLERDDSSSTVSAFGPAVSITQDELTADELAMLLPVPANVDPKKMCRFCGKTFAHPGSLGRHLDLRKGSTNHPELTINKMRAHVARRGNPEVVKARRKLRAREYNKRPYVKAKNKERRRITSKTYRVKEAAHMKFYRELNIPVLQRDATFARLVLFILPVAFWPQTVPDLSTYDQLVSRLGHDRDRLALLDVGFDIMEKAKESFNSWVQLADFERQQIWAKELRKCAEDCLGSLTMLDFTTREAYATKLAQETKSELIRHDDIVDDDLAAVAAAAEAAVKQI